MKKTLLILCALLLTAIGASAQITDVTKDYIQNPSFEESDTTQLTADTTRGYNRNDEGIYTGAYEISAEQLSAAGWTLAGTTPNVHDIMTVDAKATDNNYGVPGEPSDGTQMLYFRNAWTAMTASVTQLVELPAGTYMLTVDSKCVTTGSGQSATLVVGDDMSVNIPTHSSYSELDWDTTSLIFEVGEGSEGVTIGVKATFSTDGSGLSVLLDNFKLYSIEVEYDNNVTWKLANPSFEVDNVVENLTKDDTRSKGEIDGAWGITSLTGWDLSAASGSVSDIMTKDATATDNNFGVPGEPSNGTYMLYLRDSWATAESTVKQSVTLPAGDYKFTVDSKCVSSTGATATLVVDNKYVALTIHETANGSEETANNPFLTSWDTAELMFSLDSETTVSMGVVVDFAGGNGSFLLDNFKLYSGKEIEEEITWTMTEAGWGTMILPFAPESIPEGLTLYDGNALTIDGSTITVGTPAESIEANTPYLVKGTADTYTFTGTPTNEVEIYTTGLLTGTLVDLAVGKGAAFATDGTQYLLQNHEDEDVAFYPIIAATETEDNSKDATLDAYHCYLTVSAEESDEGEPAKLSIVLPGAGEETGIVAVEGAEAEANGAIYDLSGRRVSKAVKGVYIQNGKKVLVK